MQLVSYPQDGNEVKHILSISSPATKKPKKMNLCILIGMVVWIQIIKNVPPM